MFNSYILLSSSCLVFKTIPCQTQSSILIPMAMSISTTFFLHYEYQSSNFVSFLYYILSSRFHNFLCYISFPLYFIYVFKMSIFLPQKRNGMVMNLEKTNTRVYFCSCNFHLVTRTHEDEFNEINTVQSVIGLCSIIEHANHTEDNCREPCEEM